MKLLEKSVSHKTIHQAPSLLQHTALTKHPYSALILTNRNGAVKFFGTAGEFRELMRMKYLLVLLGILHLFGSVNIKIA